MGKEATYTQKQTYCTYQCAQNSLTSVGGELEWK